MGPSPFFWILALVLVAATLALLVVPLLRRARADTAPADDAAATAVFRDHKRQLDRDLATGAIDHDEHAASLSELTQRFGAELDVAAPPAASAAGAPRAGGFVAALALVALLPVTAGVLYFALGNPAALLPQSAAPTAPVTNAQVDAMVDDLAARLKANPDDGEGWAMLGRSYRVLGRYEPSAMAYGEAVKRLPPNAGLLVDWAEALAQAQGRSLQGKPTEILERALALDPDSAKALALGGAAAMENGDRATAVARWTKLRSVLPPGSPQLAQIDAALERAGVSLADTSTAGSAAPATGTTATGAAAAGAVAPRTAATPSAGAPRAKPAPAAQAASGAKASAGSSVSGRVELDPKLAAKVAPGDTVFIFARHAEGPRMPLAVLKLTVADLPRSFELTDAMAMAPGATLSSAGKVVVEARVSKSGNAKAATGDLTGLSEAVLPGARDLRVTIDRTVP